LKPKLRALTRSDFRLWKARGQTWTYLAGDWALSQAQHVRLIADYNGSPVDAKDAGQIVEWAATFIQTISETFDMGWK
jgi:hypothetical protein